MQADNRNQYRVIKALIKKEGFTLQSPKRPEQIPEIVEHAGDI